MEKDDDTDTATDIDIAQPVAMHGPHPSSPIPVQMRQSGIRSCPSSRLCTTIHIPHVSLPRPPLIFPQFCLFSCTSSFPLTLPNMFLNISPPPLPLVSARPPLLTTLPPPLLLSVPVPCPNPDSNTQSGKARWSETRPLILESRL